MSPCGIDSNGSLALQSTLGSLSNLGSFGARIKEENNNSFGGSQRSSLQAGPYSGYSQYSYGQPASNCASVVGAVRASQLAVGGKSGSGSSSGGNSAASSSIGPPPGFGFHQSLSGTAPKITALKPLGGGSGGSSIATAASKPQPLQTKTSKSRQGSEGEYQVRVETS